MQKVIARSADGSSKVLVVVEDLGKTLMLCSPERADQPDAIDYAVGFPKTDVSPVFEGRPN